MVAGRIGILKQNAVSPAAEEWGLAFDFVTTQLQPTVVLHVQGVQLEENRAIRHHVQVIILQNQTYHNLLRFINFHSKLEPCDCFIFFLHTSK